MKTFTIALTAAALFAFVGVDASPANAAHGQRGFGLHLGGRNVHLDIGNPHGYRAQCSQRGYRGRRGYHYDWHDTSHFDYQPGGFVRHNDHFDYVPGHWSYHQTGHWDRHRGNRHW